MSSRARAALVGFVVGCLLVALALVAESTAAGLPLRGGLVELQRRSVVVWVVESLPLLLAAVGWVSAHRVVHPATGASAEKAPVAPPPVPTTLQSANLLGPAGEEARVRALQELVKVLRDQVVHATAESRARSAYLATIGHDVRTPLHTIIGYAEMLHEDASGSGGRLADDLKVVASAARQLNERIGDLLDLSKIEVGQLAVVLEDVDLAQVCSEVRVGIGALPERGDRAFGMRIAEGARVVRGDHMRIRQILMNLIAYALGTSGEGSVALEVDRTSDRPDAWIAMRVRDSGSTLTPDEIDNLFDAYRPAAASGSPSGLGLAISRRLAELMGGRIEVEAEPGRGTTLSLLLPAARTTEAELSPRSTVALDERLAGMALVIVDPEPSGLALARYLGKAGLEVDVVSDAASARVAVRAKDADIVVLDAGVAHAWKLASDLVGDRVKVVVVSRRDEDVERALELGVTAFLVQPVERRLVLATLERCLD
jgi:signal transduction histidine kinase